MNSIRNSVFRAAILSIVALMVALSISPAASAQRRRVIVEGSRGTRLVRPMRNPYPVIVGGRRYFYNGGYFYRGGGHGYVLIPAPIGARIRVLPFGFMTFHVGPLAYYYYDGTYYNYLPDQNVYVVVEKPSGATPPASSDTQDKLILTDGTTLSGIFVGASADSVEFQVNNEVRSIPITGITSVTFAPSTYNSNGQK